MGLYASVDVLSDLQFLPMTPVLGLMPDYSAGCGTFCAVFEATAKSLCPVDTGRLQASLIADTDGMTYCEAMTDCEYAQYQEYGTWCMPAQPYFEIAVETAINAAFDSWKDAEITVFEEEQSVLRGFQQEFLSMASTAYGGAKSASAQARGERQEAKAHANQRKLYETEHDRLYERLLSYNGTVFHTLAEGENLHQNMGAITSRMLELYRLAVGEAIQEQIHLAMAQAYQMQANMLEVEGDYYTQNAEIMGENISVSQQIQHYGGMFSPPTTLIL